MTGSSIENLRHASPAILPSLLLCDFGNLEREIRQLEEAGVPGLHLDVMDGHFVPNLTYGMPVVEAIRGLTELPLDVHLMVSAPERLLDAFVSAGSDVLTVHIEAFDSAERAAETLRSIKRLGVSSGIALNPGTPLERLEGCLADADLVLVMSVEAGFGGQAFDARALDRLAELRRRLTPQTCLEVDGGVNLDTIQACTEAGAELLVVGSAIFKQPCYRDAVSALSEAARLGWKETS